MTKKMNNNPTEEDIGVICAEMEDAKILCRVGTGKDSSYGLSDRFLATLAIEITEKYKPEQKNAMDIVITSIMKTMRRMFTKEQIYDYYKVVEATMLMRHKSVDVYVHEAYVFAQNNWRKF